MNDATPVMRRPRQAWPPAVRTTAATIATAALAMVQQVLIAERRFAQCMRSHGVPGWPDPTVEQGRPAFNLLHVHGFDPNSTEIRYTKTNECQGTIQGTLPGGVPEIRPVSPG